MIRETKIVEAELSPEQRELMIKLLHEQVARATRGDDRPSFTETCLKMELEERSNRLD